MKSVDYSALALPIEASIRERGLSPGAVWLDREGALQKGLRRCDALLRTIDDARTTFSLLDVGCGPGYAVGYLTERFGSRMETYCGIDISEPLLAAARQNWPGYQFVRRDIIIDPLPANSYDFTIINGVVTAKYSLSNDDMQKLAQSLLSSAWHATKVSLSFNVTSSYVDWTRDDLFYWPIDRVADFCVKSLSRHFNIIADYGLYEYTVQVFREPKTEIGPIPASWA